MLQTVSISSKRQMTIPSKIYELLGLQVGQKLVAKVKSDSLLLTPAETVVKKAAGMIKVPQKVSNQTLERQIREARDQHVLPKTKI